MESGTGGGAGAATAEDPPPPFAPLPPPPPRVHFARHDLFRLSDPLDPLVKLSVSYAFAQSGRLATLEADLDALLEEVRPIPETLAKDGVCHFTRRDVGKLIGKTFLLSSMANLYSDILDVPDFFWDHEAYLGIYERSSIYLDVPDRTNILNSRLDIVQRLLESLSTQLTNEHSTHLEWIVIWLIVVEVVLDLLNGHGLSNIFRALWP
mmetsp:Transcript_12265/g.28787  ORF Transcript_12265/g.28787 Transcript_12265/m.28787 type:complete len:208 (+) Transcript_12265:795-1418(+)